MNDNTIDLNTPGQTILLGAPVNQDTDHKGNPVYPIVPVYEDCTVCSVTVCDRRSAVRTFTMGRELHLMYFESSEAALLAPITELYRYALSHGILEAGTNLLGIYIQQMLEQADPSHIQEISHILTSLHKGGQPSAAYYKALLAFHGLAIRQPDPSKEAELTAIAADPGHLKQLAQEGNDLAQAAITELGL